MPFVSGLSVGLLQPKPKPHVRTPKLSAHGPNIPTLSPKPRSLICSRSEALGFKYIPTSFRDSEGLRFSNLRSVPVLGEHGVLKQSFYKHGDY